MANDGRLWVRRADARPGIEIVIGRHMVVGDDDADARVAKIVAIDAAGSVELEVLPGRVESHADPLAPA